MSDSIWDDDNDDEQTEGQSSPSNGPAELRKALKKAQAEAKAGKEERDTLATQLAELTKQVKSQSLKELTKELPANVQKWIAKADVDPTPEAVAGWLTENGADFGYTPDTEGTQSAATEGAGEGFSAGYRESIERNQAMGAGRQQGNTPSGHTEAVLADLAKQAGGNPDKFYALLNGVELP